MTDKRLLEVKPASTQDTAARVGGVATVVGDSPAGEKPSGALKEIKRRIKEGGPISFAEFMEVALYHPDGGYYTGEGVLWGRDGDYYTSLDVSPVFAGLIAKQLDEMWILMGSPLEFTLLEIGSGRGLLSGGILEYAKDRYPRLYSALSVILVDKRPVVPKGFGGKVEAFTELSYIKKAPFTGVVLTNELLDALPVHRIIGVAGGGGGETGAGEISEGFSTGTGPNGASESLLKELYVGLGEDGSLMEIEGELSSARIKDYFDALDITLLSRQRAEVSLAALDWIEEVAGLLESGFVITIDYGMPARELYRPGRDGTLLCHYRHRISEDPFERVGCQDITAHVDFTSLAAAGSGAGLDLTGYTTQFYFLMGLGAAEELIEIKGTGVEEFDAIEHNQAIKKLIMPSEMGSTFKVLIQSKGIFSIDIDTSNPVLKGFSFKDMAYSL